MNLEFHSFTNCAIHCVVCSTQHKLILIKSVIRINSLLMWKTCREKVYYCIVNIYTIYGEHQLKVKCCVLFILYHSIFVNGKLDIKLGNVHVLSY